MKDVSFELRRGECLGLIGRNGAGKTTLLRMLNGLIKPDTGSITTKGQVGALIALGAGFNPILSGRENIYINASILGLTTKEAQSLYDEIVAFSGLNDFIDSPVQSYSSGMTARLGFATAIALKPDILIIDEVLSVGDRHFRAKCLKEISRIKEKSAVIMVSHDEAQIAMHCDVALHLKKGMTDGLAPTTAVIQNYMKQDLNGNHTSSTVIDEPIESARLTDLEVIEGERRIAKISVLLTTRREASITYSTLTIEDESLAMAAQSLIEGTPIVVTKGTSALSFRIDISDLGPGKYYLSNYAATGPSHRLLYNLIYASSFTIEGGNPLFSSYNPKSKAVTSAPLGHGNDTNN